MTKLNKEIIFPTTLESSKNILEVYIRAYYLNAQFLRSYCPDDFVSAQQVKFHLQNNHRTEFIKRVKKSRPLDEVDTRYPKTKRVRSVIKHELDTDVEQYSKPVYEFIYQTAEQ